MVWMEWDSRTHGWQEVKGPRCKTGTWGSRRAQSHAATVLPSIRTDVTLLDLRKPKSFPWPHTTPRLRFCPAASRFARVVL